MRIVPINRKSAKGFTLIELAVVVIVIALLAGFIGANLFLGTEGTKQKLAEVFITNKVPTAISAVQLKFRDLANVPNLQQELIDTGLDPVGVFGDAWSVSLNGRTITLDYDFSSAGDTAEFQQALQQNLNDANGDTRFPGVINSATVNGTNAVIEYQPTF